MKKAQLISYIFFVTSYSILAQENIEVISSGTSGDAILKIEADTDNNNEGDNPRIELRQDGGLHGAYIGFSSDWGGSVPDNLFRIGTRNAGVDDFTRFVINPADGKVGIGTTSPNAKLHIADQGTSGVTTLQLNNRIKFRGDGVMEWGSAADYGILSWDTANAKAIVGGKTGKDLSLFAGNGERMIIKTNGDVGIGTTSPDYKLHVTDGAQIRKTTLGVTLGSAENSWIRDEWLTGSYGPAKWNQTIAKWVRPSGTYNDIGGIVYQDEGTYFLREKAGSKLEYTNSEFLNTAYMFADIFNGNIGIGTTTPDAKLTVKGLIHSQEVKVTATAGADFVFETDYNLPTLKKVEEFIKAHKHLPEIPSAKEMQTNGLYVAEMNTKLLQKIEELTLYTIEQEKQLEKQEILIKQQDEVNQELKDRLLRLEQLVLNSNQKN